jgi:hypothetical protein
MPTITYDNNNEDNYSFDPDKIEFVAGAEKLKATTGTPEAYAYWKMDDYVNNEVMRDSANPESTARDLRMASYTPANRVSAKINNGLQGISVSSGLLRLNPGNTTDFSFERTDPFSMECWIQFTGTVTRLFVSKQNNAGNFEGYSMNTVSPGVIRFVLRDDIGNVLAIETASNYNDGSFHHVVCTYDGTGTEAGMTIYVDNVLDTVVSISGTLSGTMINPSVPFQVSGRDGFNNCIDSNTIIDEVVVYARELTAAEVAFRWNGGAGTQILPGPGVSFPTDNPSSVPKSGFQATAINDFDAVVTEPGSDAVEFVIIVDGVDKYWNGSAWVDSTGYPESNQGSVVKANISALVLAGLSTISHRRYFHSDDGSTTPELDSTQFEFDIEPTEPIFTESVITGSVFDIGSDNPDIIITIRPVKYLYGTNSIITNVTIDVIYDNNTGDFEARIYVEDDIPDELIWKFGSKEVRTKYVAGTVKFSALERIYP